jgi:hypothetical protein
LNSTWCWICNHDVWIPFDVNIHNNSHLCLLHCAHTCSSHPLLCKFNVVLIFFHFSYHHLYVFVWQHLFCRLKDYLVFKLESAMGSQKDKNWKKGIIWPSLTKRAKHFALQPEVGVALQPRIGFALQPKVIAFQQEVLTSYHEVDDDGRTRKV